MPLIHVRNLTKLYRMGDSTVRALDGVDLTIDRGEFVAITGPSGSGKSTIMHLLGCLDRPTSGQYILDGQDVSRFSDRQLAEVRNRQIGFVFQTFNLINRTTALENVGVPLFYARRANFRGPARRALERVGLAQRAGHRPNELSGGERQRVAIARAIVNDPPLVFADEPTGNLDTKTGEQIMAIFRALNEQGVTIILVTHEHEVAVQARRIVHMRDGKILWDRPTADLLRDDAAGGGGGAARRSALTAGEASTTDPAAAAMPVTARALDLGAATGAVVTEPSRTIRGANWTLGWGVAGAVLALVVVAVQSMSRPLVAAPTGVPPTADLIRGGVILLASVLAVVLSAIALVIGWRSLRRLHREPGNWHGGGRAKTGMVLGGLTLLLPVVSIVRQALR